MEERFMTKFFRKDATGTNTDIVRHRTKIQNMRNTIDELEQNPNRTELDEIVLQSYRNMLNILLQSNANAVSKIGNTKRL